MKNDIKRDKNNNKETRKLQEYNTITGKHSTQADRKCVEIERIAWTNNEIFIGQYLDNDTRRWIQDRWSWWITKGQLKTERVWR